MSTPIAKTWASLVTTTKVRPLDLQSRPRLMPGISFLSSGVTIDRIRFIEDSVPIDPGLLAIEPVVAVAPMQSERLTRVAPLLDGEHSITDIAKKCNCDGDDCERLIHELYDRAIVADMALRDAPALSFYRNMLSLGRRETVKALATSPLVARFANGTLTKRLVVGYLLEEFHLVCSAASQIAPVIASSPNERLRMMFSDYLSGEYWHGQLLKRGLLASGLSEVDVDGSDPLPATLAVINHNRNMARSDVLAYSVCLSINEGGDARASAAFSRLYDALATVVPAEVLAPSREHAELDAEDGHDTLGAEPFADEVLLSARRQDAIRREVMANVRALLEQHRQMADFYGSDSGPSVHRYS